MHVLCKHMHVCGYLIETCHAIMNQLAIGTGINILLAPPTVISVLVSGVNYNQAPALNYSTMHPCIEIYTYTHCTCIYVCTYVHIRTYISSTYMIYSVCVLYKVHVHKCCIPAEHAYSTHTYYICMVLCAHPAH